MTEAEQALVNAALEGKPLTSHIAAVRAERRPAPKTLEDHLVEAVRVAMDREAAEYGASAYWRELSAALTEYTEAKASE